MSDNGKVVCIAQGQDILILGQYVQWPDGSTIPINSGTYLRDALVRLLNSVKSPKVVWEEIAHIIGYDVNLFLYYRTMPWRCGAHSSNGRTIYHNGQLVGMMDTPELAAMVVVSLNEKEP